MARPVDGLSRGDIDAVRYDDLSFEGVHGHVGVTLFIPSIRQIGILGEPDIVVPYSSGWGEGWALPGRPARAWCVPPT
ncbi:MAG: hypothetical protein IPL45_03985 [Actinomycetales bacterium]|nr:hypothetical protein [Actinomycetales bacterium]